MQGFQDDREKVEFFISCRSLADKDTFSKSDPYVILLIQDKYGKMSEIGRTEVVNDNLNPNFSKSFILDYIFEIQQHVKLQVWDYDGPSKSQFIGEANSTISKIVGSKNQMCILDLKSETGKYSGKIILRADKVAYDNNELALQLACRKLPDTRWFGKTNPFIKILRTTENNMPIQVYQSNPVMNDCNPSFSKFNIKCQKICNGDYNLPLLLELWDYRSSGEHVYLGQTSISVNQLVKDQTKSYKLVDKKKHKDAGTLDVKFAQLIEKPSFMDYIRGGTQLSLVTAIDFTGSNGIPTHPQSLHYLQPGQMNQYQQAIVSVGEILLNYDYDKNVPVYGFGAKPRLPQLNSNQTLHCFPVNGYPDKPEAIGLQNILDIYTNFLNCVELSGPTLFNPLIQETMKLAKTTQQMNDQYHILLILTDGEIHDMEATKSSIVASSHLPMSIIIIGIGNADFTNMDILDGDSGLYDSSGRKAQRDLVQFVPFNKFKGNPHLLAEHVLAELPDQLVEYKKLTGQKPNPPQVQNINQMQINNIPQSQENFGANLAKGQFFQNLVQKQNLNQPPHQSLPQNDQQLQSHFNAPPQNQQPQFNQPIQGSNYQTQQQYFGSIPPQYPQQQYPQNYPPQNQNIQFQTGQYLVNNAMQQQQQFQQPFNNQYQYPPPQ